jgi:hypothetical protein
MRNQLQSVGSVVIAVLIFGACNVLPARSDYAWPESYVPIAQQRGFRLVLTQSLGGALARPWTLLNNPPSGLYFIAPDTLALTAVGDRRIETLFLSRSNGQVEQFESTDVFDCRGSRMHTLSVPSGGRNSSGGGEWGPVPANQPGTIAQEEATCNLPAPSPPTGG